MPTKKPTSGFDALMELALDLHWSWNHSSDEIWRQLDATLWNRTRHPYAVLHAMPRKEVERRLADPFFRAQVETLLQVRRQEIAAPAWFQQAHPQSALTCVAYFSMEFMLSEALPIYSGGLGNVAGDQLKSSSDLGVPVVGVGLLYQQGYFRQIIDRDGAQQALLPFNDPDQLPITPVRRSNGEWVRLEISLPGNSAWVRAWQVHVGRVHLYLLDTNDPANTPAHRGITSQLYGGGADLRIQQEIILGIGGWRLLTALGIKPEVCHLNEGHAAFAVLERARSLMEETRMPFPAALTTTRAGNLFTTHTAVAAGFDRFAPAVINHYLGTYAEQKLGLTSRDLLALGRAQPDDSSESFNMAYLAIRGSGAVNGVSRLHAEVSRQLFASLFPRWPLGEIPIGYVTNGVHMPTWDSAEADALWTEACGKKRWLGTTEELERHLRMVADTRLWELRNVARRKVVDFAREHVAHDLTTAGTPAGLVEQSKQRLNPNALTLGFARRFASYKRPNLLLHDPERLRRLLSDPQRPVQLLLAGKAHPADQPGQALIREWTRFIKDGPPYPPVFFLADYDMRVAEALVQGVDVWINTPRRPWEASGTSGMKVLVNGGLNLSELDGWWAEAYSPQIGWALGDGREHGDDPAWDATEAEMLYECLEQNVIPEFYARDDDGIPKAWINRVRESMAQLTPRFSANRSVREYTESHYLPAATEYRERTANHAAAGRRAADRQRLLEQAWPTLNFRASKTEHGSAHHMIEVEVDLHGIDSDLVQVEIYANGPQSTEPVRQPMTRVGRTADRSNAAYYRATVPADRPLTEYTARVIPRSDDLAVPLEAGEILWQR